MHSRGAYVSRVDSQAGAVFFLADGSLRIVRSVLERSTTSGDGQIGFLAKDDTVSALATRFLSMTLVELRLRQCGRSVLHQEANTTVLLQEVHLVQPSGCDAASSNSMPNVEPLSCGSSYTDQYSGVQQSPVCASERESGCTTEELNGTSLETVIWYASLSPACSPRQTNLYYSALV